MRHEKSASEHGDALYVGASEHVDFMARAWQMEVDAARRYGSFAEQLEARENHKVARLFRELARIEELHAKHILQEMGWSSGPTPTGAFAWPGPQGPETASFDALQLLKHPYHALEIALRCEVQAQRYFEDIAASAAPQNVRAAAARMALEEREHQRLIHSWLARVPRPLSWE